VRAKEALLPSAEQRADLDICLDWLSAVFRRWLSTAPMPRSKEKNPLQCRECGSRAFAIHGPTIRNGIVRCAECLSEIGSLDAFSAMVEAHFKREDQKERKRLH